MLKKSQDRRLLILGILALMVLVAITLGNIAYTRNFPGGNHFVTNWAGTRAFFADGTSPYSDRAITRIQSTASWVTDRAEKNSLRFTSPLYNIFLYAPFALIKDYPVARGIWMTLLEICLLGIPILTFRLLRTRPPFWLILASIMVTLFSAHGIRSLVDGSIVILTTVILLLLLGAIDRRQDEIAGILLALSTINLTSTILVVLFVIIWAFRKQRKTILNWFAGTIGLLIGFSILLIPNWIVQALQSLIQGFAANQAGSPGALMTAAWGAIGIRLSIFLTVVLAGILLREWIQSLNGNDVFFVWCIFITLSIGQWIGIPTQPANFILLVPGILFSLMVLLTRWKATGNTIIYIVFGLLLVVPWVLTLVLAGNTSRAALFLPFPLVAIILLYWTKWWAVGPVT